MRDRKGATPAIVCRDHAVAAVAGGLSRPPALVLVEGEAGVGKTRLVRENLESGGATDHTVLVVEFHPSADLAHLAAVVDGVRRLWPSIAGMRLSTLAGALRPLFPEWGADLPPTPEAVPDARQTRARVYWALTDLLDRLGVDVLVFHDAQWADTASLEWLLTTTTYVSRSRSVVVTYRLQDLPLGSLLNRLTSRIPARMAHVRIVREPLTVAGIQRLAKSTLGVRDVSNEFATFLHERTGGLPLAAVESLRQLRDRGGITREDDGWATRTLAELRVPPTVRNSVLERVGRRAPAVQRVLEEAAVLAEPADETLLAAVAGLEQRTARQAVATGLQSGLLGEQGPGRVGFRHQLAAEAMEDSIPIAERQRMHQRAAETLQATRSVSPARLYRHLKLSGDITARSRYTDANPDLAAEAGDDRTAITVLRELLTIVDYTPAERARLVRTLGEAAAAKTALLSDRIARLVDTLRDVVADGGIPQGERGEIRLLLGRLLLWRPVHRQAAYEQIKAAVPELAHRPALACQAMLLLGKPLPQNWPIQRHLQRAQRASAHLTYVKAGPAQVSLAAGRARTLLTLGEHGRFRPSAPCVVPAGGGPWCDHQRAGGPASRRWQRGQRSG